MWSGPRNISTALLRSFSNRDDTIVYDEPFYSYYLKETGLNHPMRDKIIDFYPTKEKEVIEIKQHRYLLHICHKLQNSSSRNHFYKGHIMAQYDLLCSQ